MTSPVVDLNEWRRQRQGVIRAWTPPSRSGQPDHAAEPGPSTLFFADRPSVARHVLLGLLAAFLLTVVAAMTDAIDRRLLIFGLLGTPIIGFILWATHGEDTGERPLYALDALGLVLDPSGRAERLTWDAMADIHAEHPARTVIITREMRTNCSGCTPASRRLVLDGSALSAKRDLLSDELMQRHADWVQSRSFLTPQAPAVRPN